MYFVNNLLLLEMPKAGSTFMRRFLENYYGKEKIRKVGIHNGVKDRALKEKILSGELTVLSTVRNPYDWYVSLFTWNSMGKGIYHNIGLKRYELSMDGIKSVVKNPLILFRDLTQWKEVFQNPQSPELFQKWIYLMLHKQSHFVEKEFGDLSKYFGFCTYRFLQLHTFDFYTNYSQILLAGSAKRFYDEYRLPIVFLKTESLTKQLIENTEKIGLDKRKVTEVLEKMVSKNIIKANSTDRLSYDVYYNKETINLIQEKDKFLFDRFNYTF